MKIATLGWGSLIWDPRDLPREGVWQQGGPTLPIEFSRISSDCRLTLVIDDQHGAEVPTRFVLSPRTDLRDAVEDLRKREGTTNRNIGYVMVQPPKEQSRLPVVATRVREWAAEHAFEAAVWTDLSPNYTEETGARFSIDAAVEYLQGLPKSAAERAKKYIANAPPEVNTLLRGRLREIGWLGEPDHPL